MGGNHSKRKRYLAVLMICLAWQAEFIWLCTLGESVTSTPWFFRCVPLTEERWEWLLDAPGSGALGSSTSGWVGFAVWIMRCAFIIMIAAVVIKRWRAAPRTERIFYAVLLAVAVAAYMLFTSQMVRNYKQMLERYYLWQEAMDVELLSVTALAAVFVPTLLKSRPEGQNNIA